MPKICKINCEELELINNDQFNIKKLTTNTIIIKKPTKIIKINIAIFQEYFYVAYCSKIHKSQGASFYFPYITHEFNRVDKRLKYFSLTRATDIKLINIV